MPQSYKGWVFPSGYTQPQKQKFSEDRYWKKAYPNDGVSISYLLEYIDGPPVQIEIIGHYGEQILLPIDTMDKALKDADRQLRESIMTADGEMRNSLLCTALVKYAVKHGLMCYPVEEINY